ncbi:MAG: hypothetical protein ABI665_21980 [Vicinamibacterales bacterium]
MHRLARGMMGALVIAAIAGVVAWIAWSIRPGVSPLITVTLAIATLLALHCCLIFAEHRGWVYYRKGRGSYGGLGTATNFLNMYDPSRKHLQEVVREREWKREEDDDGDDPKR